MELIPPDGHCIVADDTIVWCDDTFKEWFSHRGIGPGARLSQLFQASGPVYEDQDRLGKKRFFSVKSTPTLGQNGEKVSDNIRIRNVTLRRVLTDISKLSSQTETPKKLFEKTLWLLRDTTHYLAFAGFIARDGKVELVSSKGWTEKLKSYISWQDIAPDSPSLTGRAAYYHRQMVMAMKDYDISDAVKAAIDKLGGEYLVVTPLLDGDTLVGVLTVINDKAMTPADSEVLQSICGQLASALNLKLREEAAMAKADEAALIANLASRALEDAIFLMSADKRPADSALEIGRAVGALMCSFNEGSAQEYVSLKDAVDFAVAGAMGLAEAGHKRLNVRARGLDGVEVGPLLKFAVYEVLKNSVRNSASQRVDVEVRLVKERSGARRLEVSDNGPGIPDEYKSEVFRPNKTGMELYVVKQIARLDGGRVWVEDKVHGDYSKGACIVITMPVR